VEIDMALEATWFNGVLYDAQDTRHGTTVFAGASRTANRSRNGVKYTNGDDMQVTVSGSTATIKPGLAFLEVSQGLQDGYVIRNDANHNIVLDPSHATLSRYDIIWLRIRDTDLDGTGVKAADFGFTKGADSSSPVEPAAPANSMVLARLLIPPASGTITVTDRRPWLSALGGVARYESGIPTDLPDGVPFYLSGTGKMGYMHSGLERWIYDPSISWVNLSLNAGFETASGDTPQMLVEGHKRTLRGMVQRTGGAGFAGNTVYTLDQLAAADRPPAAYEHQYPAITSLGATQFAGVIRVHGGTGNITFIMPTNNSSAFVCLDGISWSVI
jgi:hypothetical protein